MYITAVKLWSSTHQKKKIERQDIYTNKKRSYVYT